MANNAAASLPQDATRIGEPPDDPRRPTPARPRLEPLSAIAVPLEGDSDTAIGAICLYESKSPRGFSPEDRALLRLISANAGAAVRQHRARLSRARGDRRATLGPLLSGLVHEMATPLDVIGGYVEQMATMPDPARRAEHARLIVKQLELVRGVQREMSELARGELGT
jgi:GAF domain-containing protein